MLRRIFCKISISEVNAQLLRYLKGNESESKSQHQRNEDYRAVGTFLVFTAEKKEGLSNSEYSKATREVDYVAIGRYEQAQKRGNSIKF